MASFPEQTFSSYTEFEDAFKVFRENNFVSFRKKTSETFGKANEKSKAQIPPCFVYSRVEFTCTHYGQPQSRGNGIKSRTKHTATGCEAKFVLKYDYYDKVLKIQKPKMEHNHPTTKETYGQEYQVKRLTQGEKEVLKEIVDLNPRNENLMKMINEKYSKAYTLTEVRALKNQLKSSRQADDVTDLFTNLEQLQEHGQVKVVLSDSGSGATLDMVAFSTHAMVDLFRQYPEVIYVDGTYKNNKSGFPLYQVMVEDGCGKGRTVFYSFVRQETADLLSTMMSIFKDFMGDVSGIQFSMTDKDINEINAITNNMPHVTSMLCAFHVHKAMKAKAQKMQCSKEVRDSLQQQAYVLVTTNDIATFNNKLLRIKNLSPEFYLYLETHWLSNVESWAYHARLHSRLFFNDTNNKCEGENRRLKEILNTNTRLAAAVKHLFQHALTQQLEVSTAAVLQSTSCHLYRDANPRLSSLYSRFTAYAVQLMINDHLSFPLEVNAFGESFDCSDPSGVLYRVSGRPLCCQCPFFSQTSLPCCHVVSVFSQSFDVSAVDLYNSANRWLKSNNLSSVGSAPQVNPVDLRIFSEPEARHHRTEAVLGRLSCLLKLCGSAEFLERISRVESIVEAWESGNNCDVLLSGSVGEGVDVLTDVVDGGDLEVRNVGGGVAGGEGDDILSDVVDGGDLEVRNVGGGVAGGEGDDILSDVVDGGDLEVRNVGGGVAGGEGDDVLTDVVEGGDLEVRSVGGGVAGGEGDDVLSDVVEGGDLEVRNVGGGVAGGEGDDILSDVVEGGDLEVRSVGVVGETGEGVDVLTDVVEGGDLEVRSVGVVGEGVDVLTDVVEDGDLEVRNGVGESGDGVSADGVEGGGFVLRNGAVAGGEGVDVLIEGRNLEVRNGAMSLDDLKNLNVRVPNVRKRGRPKLLKTRSYKRAKRVRFSVDICYVCYQEEVPRELCVDGRMDWVGCSRCPRWYHNVCLDAVPAADGWVCKFCCH